MRAHVHVWVKWYRLLYIGTILEIRGFDSGRIYNALV